MRPPPSACCNAAMPEPAAHVDAAIVSVDGRRVLGPLSLEVRTGEHWALLGPNGAGKTTLLSLLGAQRHPSAGSVHVLGQELGRTDIRELRRRIGVVGHSISDRLPFQASALEIVLTGKDGLLAPWWGEFDDTDREEAHALLKRLRCDQLAEQPFGHCSQGERQRVLIAALPVRPPPAAAPRRAGRRRGPARARGARGGARRSGARARRPDDDPGGAHSGGARRAR